MDSCGWLPTVLWGLVWEYCGPVSLRPTLMRLSDTVEKLSIRSAHDYLKVQVGRFEAAAEMLGPAVYTPPGLVEGWLHFYFGDATAPLCVWLAQRGALTSDAVRSGSNHLLRRMCLCGQAGAVHALHAVLGLGAGDARECGALEAACRSNRPGGAVVRCLAADYGLTAADARAGANYALARAMAACNADAADALGRCFRLTREDIAEARRVHPDLEPGATAAVSGTDYWNTERVLGDERVFRARRRRPCRRRTRARNTGHRGR